MGDLDALVPVEDELDDEFGDALGDDAILLDVDDAVDGVLALEGVDGCVTTVLALCCLPDEQPTSTPNRTTPTTERFTNTARSLPARRPNGSAAHTPVIDIGSGTPLRAKTDVDHGRWAAE